MPDNGDSTEVETTVTSQMGGVTEIVTAGSEAAGAAKEVASIEKFKLHKDNPTQVPVGRKL